MIYLLAKYTLLFLLAAMLGFILGHWWSRRRIVDVTESYADLQKASGRTDEANWERLWQRLDAIPAPQPQQAVDLQPVHSELNTIRREISGLPQVDLAPVDSRLHKVETELSRLGQRLATPPPAAPRAEPDRAKADKPRLLGSPIYGKKDDLKRISGIGPKLEQLLNKNGIYYYWQIASWSPRDVEAVDEQLDVFKGRISRDDWVAQARKLKRLPDAARMPAE